MNMHEDLHGDDRLHALAREVGMERSLYIGETIGNMLIIASQAIESLSAWTRRVFSRARHDAVRRAKTVQ